MRNERPLLESPTRKIKVPHSKFPDFFEKSRGSGRPCSDFDPRARNQEEQTAGGRPNETFPAAFFNFFPFFAGLVRGCAARQSTIQCRAASLPAGTAIWAANKRFEISKFKFKFPRARTYELLVLGCTSSGARPQARASGGTCLHND